MKKTVLAILLSAIWISISEFVRNTFILHHFWTEHFQKLGLTFPEQPMNGAVWGIWSLCFAIVIYIIARKFSLFHTTLLAWLTGFVLMWLVIGNLVVLPYRILPIAIPLSLLEAFLASYITKKISGEPS